MKYQKVVTLIILLLSATFAFTSCNDDGYSLDKFWLEVGTIEKTSDQDYRTHTGQRSCIVSIRFKCTGTLLRK